MGDDERNEDSETKDEKGTEVPVKAWIEPLQSKNETQLENPFKSSYDIIVNFSECTTIQCLAYIFFYYQTIIGRVFWFVVIIAMATLGLYWIISAYIDWQNKPVLTTITTTAFPVKQIEFPALTICSQGMNWHLFNAAFWKLFLDYLDKKNEGIDMTPYEAATITLKIQESLPLNKIEIQKNNLLQQKIAANIFKQFTNESFPGISDGLDMIFLLMLINSRNPDNSLATEVAIKGGYNPCKSSSQDGQPDEPPCSNGFVLDSGNGLCYRSLLNLNDVFNSKSKCKSLGADLIQFDSDAEVDGLVKLLKNGSLKLPPGSNGFFFLDASRGANSSFSFGDDDPISDSFSKIVINPDDGSQYCLLAKLDSETGKLETFQSNCHKENATICYKTQYVSVNCSSSAPFTQHSMMDIFFDPNLQQKRQQGVAQMKQYNLNVYQKLNKVDAFHSMFSALWYASLPCSELRGLTGFADGEKSILRYCEWKGDPLPCASIFRAFPTEKGMCCSFNMKAAEEIFQGNTYANIITELQQQDMRLSFSDPKPPTTYTSKNEPRTSAGQNKGLVLILDAHTNLLSTVSVDSDTRGFRGLISQKGSFPYTMFEGFDIKPGHNNLVAITGTEVKAEESLRKINVSARKCLFSDENDIMKLHNNYSFTNCIFECGIIYAKENHSCTPWFFPNADDNIVICDPWETTNFFQIMLYEVPDGMCDYCLPDCSTTIYETSVTSVAFQDCKMFNFGVSPQCNPDNGYMPQPRKFASKILEEFSGVFPQPNYLSKIQTNLRNYSATSGIFPRDAETYDAYEEDIAMVQIYFKKLSFIELGSQPRMTWIDFLAAVGGLLGLVLGMGIVSFIELFWLFMRLCARKLGLTNWIR